jgi:predicted nucleotide-binding protein (sugar kinase/HSP70/actin superfamily)
MGRQVREIIIPKGLLNSEFYDMWSVFLEGIGIRLCGSGRSEREIVELGVRNSEPESCFSCKRFMGECVGNDIPVFVPMYLSTRKGYFTCPKVSAIADVLRSKDIDVISPIFDVEKSTALKILMDLGDKLGYNRESSLWAAHKALNTKAPGIRMPTERWILLLGHKYVLEECNVQRVVENNGFRCVAIQDLEKTDKKFDFMWDFAEDEISKLSGMKGGCAVLMVSSFGCGPDSVIAPVAEQICKDKQLPFMQLFIDENTGMGGIETRIEAFIDTITYGNRSYLN